MTRAKGGYGKAITEIKTIKLELNTDSSYKISINGGGLRRVGYNIPADNYRQWARIFTRIAMEMWANVDATLNQKEE